MVRKSHSIFEIFHVFPPQLSDRQRFSHWIMLVCHANTGEIKTRQNEVPKMNFFSLCRMCLCVFVNGCRSAKGCFRQERRNFVEFLSNNKKKVVGACLDLLICICSYKFVPPGVVFFFFCKFIYVELRVFTSLIF